jgi:diguanylate cyclase (GGDEF)-like protein
MWQACLLSSGLVTSLIRLRMALLRYITIMFSCFVAAGALAHELRSQHWGASDGLAHISARAITQTPDGLMWIGTENGLSMFDGVSFKTLNADTVPAMTSDWINAVITGPEGKLWVGTNNGMLIRDMNFEFEAISAPPGITQILDFSISPNGRLWVAAHALLFVDKREAFIVEADMPDVVEIAATDDKVYLLDSLGSLYAYDIATNRVGMLPMPADFSEPKHISLIKNQLLIGSTKGAFVYESNDSITGVWRQISDSPVKLLTRESAQHNPWILEDSALVEISPSLTAARLDLSQVFDQGNLDLLDLFICAGGNFWLGTMTEGFFGFWTQGLTVLDAAVGATSTKTWSFFADDTLYAVGDEGVFRRLGDKQWATHITTEDIGDVQPYSFLRYEDKEFLGTRSGLFSRSITDVPGKTEWTREDITGGSRINTFYPDEDGVLVATSYGLFRYDPQALQQWQEIDDFRSKSVRALYKEPSGRLWVGTESGLKTYLGGFSSNVDDATLASTFVSAILPLDDSRIAVGTYGQGLFIYDTKRKGDWLRYNYASGLPFDDIFAITSNKGYVWVSTANGVFRFAESPDFGEWIPADVVLRDDGAITRSRIRCCNGAGNNRAVIWDDYIFLPTLTGIVRLDTTIAPTTSIRPLVSSVRVNGKSVPYRGGRVALQDYGSDVEIDFTAPVFANENRPVFRYKLSSYHDEWVYPGTRRTAYFSNMPSGESVFELEARLSAGDWVAAQRLELNVPQRFIDTMWFKLLVGLLLLLISWGIVLARTNQLRSRSAALTKLVERRTDELQQANQELARINEELLKQSVTDALTGLHNRWFMQGLLPALLGRIKRREQMDDKSELRSALLLIDIDFFKEVNDRYGHEMGDSVLKDVATELLAAARGEDYLLRWGGEEFLLVIPEIKPADIVRVHDRLHLSLANIAQNRGLQRPITVSVGIVFLPLDGHAIDEQLWDRALSMADFGVYHVKSTGKNASGLVSEIVDLEHQSLLVRDSTVAQEFDEFADDSPWHVDVWPSPTRGPS